MDVDRSFLLQLAKSIQAWLEVEIELYLLYSMFMEGANSHLISVTFNSIQSVDARLALLSSCFILSFDRHGDDLRAWKRLFSKVEKLNKQRNKLVHEPVSVLYSKGAQPEVTLGPSHMNALALVKGQTTHQGAPVVSANYSPSKVQLLQDHRLAQNDVAQLERAFHDTALELRAYREAISPKVAAALKEARGRRK